MPSRAIGISQALSVGTLQSAPGKLAKNLQLTIEDAFADGRGHPLFGDARRYGIVKAHKRHEWKRIYTLVAIAIVLLIIAWVGRWMKML